MIFLYIIGHDNISQPPPQNVEGRDICAIGIQHLGDTWILKPKTWWSWP